MQEFVKKLIERLEKELNLSNREKERCIKESPMQFDSAKGYSSGMANAIQIVNQLAEEYNGGWIPVDKTLPQKSGYYTVTEEQYSLDMRRKIGVRVSYEVQFDAEEQRWYRAKFLKVIAWKEHETPYQPKGE